MANSVNLNLAQIAPYNPIRNEHKQNAAVPIASASLATSAQQEELPKVSGSLLEAYMVRKNQQIAAADLRNQKVEWHNDLKTLFNTNQAKIMAIIPRTFNASDAVNADGLIQMNLGERTGKFTNAVEKLDELKDMGISSFPL